MEEDDKIKYKFGILKFCGVDMQRISFFDVYLKDKESVSVCIIDSESDEAEDIVFLHGLTGSSLFLYRTFSELSKTKRLIIIDLPGMGFSSRTFVDFKGYDFKEAENFFIERLKIVFSKINVTRFHIIAHSFGAYIGSLYAIKYSCEVISLILISPVGIGSCFVEWYSTKIEDDFQAFLYSIKKPPTEGIKLIPFYESIINNMLSHKLKGINNSDELKAFTNAVSYIYTLKSTSEKLIYHFFNGSIQAYKPIIYYHESLQNIPIDFIYGDTDWNPIDHAEDVNFLFSLKRLVKVK